MFKHFGFYWGELLTLERACCFGAEVYSIFGTSAGVEMGLWLSWWRVELVYRVTKIVKLFRWILLLAELLKSCKESWSHIHRLACLSLWWLCLVDQSKVERFPWYIWQNLRLFIKMRYTLVFRHQPFTKMVQAPISWQSFSTLLVNIPKLEITLVFINLLIWVITSQQLLDIVRHLKLRGGTWRLDGSKSVIVVFYDGVTVFCSVLNIVF